MGFDDSNDHVVIVRFQKAGPLGLSLMNCKNAKGETQAVIHTIKEGGVADAVRQLTFVYQTDY